MGSMTIEKKYVIIALIFGLLFIFLIPPFEAPDEATHFLKVYSISKGNLYSQTKNGVVGEYFPTELYKYIDEMTSYTGDVTKKYSFYQFYMDQYSNFNYSKKKFKQYITSSITPIAYIAPTIGVIFSKLCAKIFALDQVNITHMIYFARFFSLLLMIVLMYYSIKITPIFKNTFAVVALIPQVIFIGSYITYDTVLISLTTLALAIMLRINYDDKLKTVPKRYIITLTIIGIFLLNIKVIYFALYMLLLLIPFKKVKSKKNKIKIACVMIGVILLATIVLKIPMLFQGTTQEPSVVSKQLHFVMTHPIQYTGIILRAINDQRGFILETMVGVFGNIDTVNPLLIIVLTYIWVLAVAISDGVKDKEKVSVLFKILSIIYAIMIVFAVYSVMYISWTPKINGGIIGGSQIFGVQGRYFVPLFLPLLLVFSTKKIKEYKIFEVIRNNSLIPCIIFLIISSITVLLRFWI